jgi:hypothetical protein
LDSKIEKKNCVMMTWLWAEAVGWRLERWWATGREKADVTGSVVLEAACTFGTSQKCSSDQYLMVKLVPGRVGSYVLGRLFLLIAKIRLNVYQVPESQR